MSFRRITHKTLAGSERTWVVPYVLFNTKEAANESLWPHAAGQDARTTPHPKTETKPIPKGRTAPSQAKRTPPLSTVVECILAVYVSSQHRV